MDTIKQATLERLDGAWRLIREAQEEIKRVGALVPGHMQVPLDQAERAVRVLTRIFEGWEPRYIDTTEMRQRNRDEVGW